MIQFNALGLQLHLGMERINLNDARDRFKLTQMETDALHYLAYFPVSTTREVQNWNILPTKDNNFLLSTLAILLVSSSQK